MLILLEIIYAYLVGCYRRSGKLGKADASGRLSFRGFKGRYRLTWRRADGTTETRELNLER